MTFRALLSVIPSWMAALNTFQLERKEIDENRKGFFRKSQMAPHSLATLAKAITESTLSETSNFGSKIVSKRGREISQGELSSGIERAVLGALQRDISRDAGRVLTVGFDLSLAKEGRAIGVLKEAFNDLDIEEANFALSETLECEVKPLVCDEYFTEGCVGIEGWHATLQARGRRQDSFLRV